MGIKKNDIDDIKKILKKNQENETNKLNRNVIIEKCYKGRSISPYFINRTKVFYPDVHSVLDEKEIEFENQIVPLLQKFSIYATQKTNKRSLPYQGQVVTKLGIDVNMSSLFDFEEVYRNILKELLQKDARKIRFYIHIDTYQEDVMPWLRCGVRYCFRYFIH